MRINIRFAGAGGQGVILSSVLLAKAYGLGENYNISQTQSYGPEARGGFCKAEVVISDEEIDYMKVDMADVFIAFNQIGYDKHISTVKKEALILINSTLVETERANSRFVKKTVSLPAWLAAKADEDGVNCSKLFQQALINYLGLKNI